ncbi:hypothetical protein EX895_005188 [Sporisorium graminicola]|uniref:Uncharacterized protein n=1 Tax=Sporisorium graminicola TaxID=280036 RepID=A0A4V6ET91_9BASI|nr:hypothetical protein EX895_005188 [Sporisorium graminicola]TKY85649.1 hypothetical protein EX895_005188 [Sporisorium graminicola]
MKNFQVLLIAVLLAVVGIASAGLTPPADVAANKVTAYLWNQATEEGHFVNRLPAAFAQQQGAWENFLRTEGQPIVDRLFGIDARSDNDRIERAMYQGRGRFLRALSFEEVNALKYQQRVSEPRMKVSQELIKSFAEQQEKSAWGRSLSLGRGESSTGGF